MTKQTKAKTLKDKQAAGQQPGARAQKPAAAQKPKGPKPDFSKNTGRATRALANERAMAENLKHAEREARAIDTAKNWEDMATTAQARYSGFVAGEPGNYLIVDGDRGHDFVIYERFFHANNHKEAGHVLVIEEHHARVEGGQPVYIMHAALFKKHVMFADGYVGQTQQEMLDLFRSVMPTRIAAEKEFRARAHVAPVPMTPAIATMANVDQEHATALADTGPVDNGINSMQQVNHEHELETA